MPNNPNAAKAHRQSEKRRVVNRAGRTVLKNLVKRFRTSLEAPVTTAPTLTLTDITKRVDQAASKKLIHKNKAARIKSRLTKAANQKSAASK
jgi:small subunit ribosomal protein S20